MDYIIKNSYKLYVLLFLLIGLLFIHFYISVAEEVDVVKQRVGKADIVEFTTEVYDLYINEDFAAVYRSMHPSIKADLDRVLYMGEQEESFAKYKTEITNFKVNKVNELTKIPGDFRDFVSFEEADKAVEVEVSYKLHFTSGGERKEDDVDKEVYLCTKDNQIYLLWDPDVLD
ncbi:MAG: hypothetical protein ACOCZT_01865 [Halanaerobiales bacterium]